MKNTTKKKRKRATHYINSKELIFEIQSWQKTGTMSNRLGELFLLLVKNISNCPNFVGYTNNWKDEMIEQGILFLCKYAKGFNSEHERANVFAYCSQIVWNAFIQYIKAEKKYERLKRNLIDAAYENFDPENADDKGVYI